MIKNKHMVEYTIGTGRLHLYSLLMLFPLLLVTLVPFLLIWDTQLLIAGWEPFYNYFIPVLLSGIVMHELLHGIGWSFFLPGGIRSVKFGINWKFLAPYCHCKLPLKAMHYMIGTALPLVILGILPVLAGIGTGDSPFLFFGILFTLGSGGDIISLFMLIKLDKGSLIYDHPDKPGFCVKP
jgi:hypothetical protein